AVRLDGGRLYRRSCATADAARSELDDIDRVGRTRAPRTAPPRVGRIPPVEALSRLQLRFFFRPQVEGLPITLGLTRSIPAKSPLAARTMFCSARSAIARFASFV